MATRFFKNAYVFWFENVKLKWTIVSHLFNMLLFIVYRQILEDNLGKQYILSVSLESQIIELMQKMEIMTQEQHADREKLKTCLDENTRLILEVERLMLINKRLEVHESKQTPVGSVRNKLQLYFLESKISEYQKQLEIKDKLLLELRTEAQTATPILAQTELACGGNSSTNLNKERFKVFAEKMILQRLQPTDLGLHSSNCRDKMCL